MSTKKPFPPKPVSAGLLCFRVNAEDTLEVLLAHPGGPYFQSKDLGAWGIPKGMVNPGEGLLQAAQREFAEEIGVKVDPSSRFIPLGSIKMRSGKTVHAWGFEGDMPVRLTPPPESVYSLEWPPRSGRYQTFPEVDRAEFFDLEHAAQKLIAAQVPFLERLSVALQENPASRYPGGGGGGSG